MNEEWKKWIEIAKVVVGAFIAISAIFAGTQGGKVANEIAKNSQATEKQTQILASPGLPSYLFGQPPASRPPVPTPPNPQAPR